MANTYNLSYTLKQGKNGIVNLKSKGSINWFTPMLFFYVLVLLLTFIFFIPMGYEFVAWLKTVLIMLGIFTIFFIVGGVWFQNLMAQYYVFNTKQRTVWQKIKGKAEGETYKIPANAWIVTYSYDFISPATKSPGFDTMHSVPVYRTLVVEVQEKTDKEVVKKNWIAFKRSTDNKIFTIDKKPPIPKNATLLSEYLQQPLNSPLIYGLLQVFDLELLDLTQSEPKIYSKTDTEKHFSELLKAERAKSNQNSIEPSKSMRLKEAFFVKRMSNWLPVVIFLLVITPLSAFYGFFVSLKNNNFWLGFLLMFLFWLLVLLLRRKMYLSPKGLKVKLLLIFIPLFTIKQLQWNSIGDIRIKSNGKIHIEFIEKATLRFLYKIQVADKHAAESITDRISNYYNQVFG